MDQFEFDLDIDAELAGIRGHRKERVDRSPAQSAQSEAKTENKGRESPVSQDRATPAHGAGGSSNQATTEPGANSEPESPSLSHTHGGEGAADPVPGDTNGKKGEANPVDWKRFKTIPGVFDHVGGERPVRLNPNIKKTQVAGIPEPLLWFAVEQLKERHTGAVITFPWGEYTITEKNKVFTTKSSFLRYLLFDRLRDNRGTHLQYAKQWMVLQHPVFDEGFDPETHLGPNNDELDIYALLFVAHTAESYSEEASDTKMSGSEMDHQTAERLGMINMGVGRVLDKLKEQEELFRTYAERNTVLQTVMLLDRMGMLTGGLPKDVGAFVRILEENRDTLTKTDKAVSEHIQREHLREKRLAKQERMRQMHNRR